MLVDLILENTRRKKRGFIAMMTSAIHIKILLQQSKLIRIN